MNKDLKKKYKREFFELREIINKWDPYSLVEEGAPKDEFEAEIAVILAKLKGRSSVDEIAKLVSEVFTNAFDATFTVESCRVVAEKIYVWHKAKTE